ncbi:(2Fe-2S)-binding protein [Myxococcota bacterium]|jgi:NADH dehydrogenase/NADH:ubiquinone oxidoreductase subunit G|nr:(2Fe-2S)-binding protein [Myxococcota bacterium]PKN24351.1 MAG: (2Fe-2S)-binding protein [Deltaproteobacteria bacterium HGW-Deltaproteobacteria-22]
MVEILLNGQKYEARAGETILEVAQRVGIDIPTLCHSPAVKPTGSCRVCLVEFSVRGGSKKLTSSCTYVVEPNMSVETHSERVLKHRRTVLELLQARVPDSPELKKMAKDNDVRLEPRFPVMKEDCILCGLCVRVCDEVVGAKAIELNDRGTKLTVGGPFMESPEDCIGCGACVYVCPVNCIKMEQTAETRKIVKWDRELPMRKCETCGYPFMPNFQVLRFKKWADMSGDFFKICPDCRK